VADYDCGGRCGRPNVDSVDLTDCRRLGRRWVGQRRVGRFESIYLTWRSLLSLRGSRVTRSDAGERHLPGDSDGHLDSLSSRGTGYVRGSLRDPERVQQRLDVD